MGRSRTLTPGASPDAHFGAEVRRAREAAGMTQQELGDLASADKSTVSRIEAGFTSPDERFARTCADTFGNPWFLRFWKDSRTWDTLAPPVREFTVYEQEAVVLWCIEHTLVPGLFQTEAYARAVIEKHVDVTPDQVPGRVRARLAKQAVLNREAPPRYWVLIDEQVLYRKVAGPEVMAAQLVRLAELARRPNITVQVLSRDSVHTGLSGAFAAAQTADNLVIYKDDFTDGTTTDIPAAVSQAITRFDILRSEAYRRSESLEIIDKAEQEWQSRVGGRALTVVPTDSASKPRREQAP
jgi:transcriptional regulator with XRE-family HTH domain